MNCPSDYFHFLIATNTNNIMVEHCSEAHFLNEIVARVHAGVFTTSLSHDKENNRDRYKIFSEQFTNWWYCCNTWFIDVFASPKACIFLLPCLERQYMLFVDRISFWHKENTCKNNTKKRWVFHKESRMLIWKSLVTKNCLSHYAAKHEKS